MPVLELARVSRWYGEVIALNDVSVGIEPGITALLGPNGAGKSTFLRLTVGLLKPSQGDVRVLGEDPWANPALLGRIGYVPDAPPPWRELSGLRCAERAAHLSGIQGEAATRAAADALATVGLTGSKDKRVAAYSHGMQQRLKFALALVHDPELLVLDEPLIGTDPVARHDLLALLRKTAADGRSVLLSTHVLTDVEALTDRIALLHHGRLMAHGQVHEIRDLLERYPRTVRIATPEPRELGARLWGWDSVLGMEADDQAVTVRTHRPAEFYAGLQELLIERNARFTSVTSPDDTVEAVFRYLVG